MNNRTTLWLSALALGLFAYIFLVERRSPVPRADVSAAIRLMPTLVPENVTAVEITRSNQVIRADRVNDQWRLSNPIYPAQALAIDQFLQGLTNLHRKTEISAQEIISQSGGLSPFGLDPPWATCKLWQGTNQLQFRVGSKTLLGDQVYVQPVGASGIATTEAALIERLPSSANQWRNPLLMFDGTPVFDRIAITAGSRPLRLERDTTNQLWRLVEPAPPTRADLGQVEYLMRQLRIARVAQFVTDDPKADLEAFGLQTPEVDLTLSAGNTPVFQLQFGKSPTNDPAQVYARCLSHTNVVLVSRELAELVAKPSTEFRDRVLLSFRPNLIDRIEGQVNDLPPGTEPGRTNEVFAVRRFSEQDWQIVAPFQAPADRQLMQLFLEDLSRIEIIRFEKDVVADFSPYGLVNPVRQYVLKTSVTNASVVTNPVLVQVDFGASPTNELDKVYCRRSDEKSVYVVAYADMDRLERAAFALRDRHIWQFASSNVAALTISQRGQKRQLFRDASTRTWFRDDQVKNAEVEETLHRLGDLQAEAWVKLGEDQAKLLKVDGSDYQLIIDLVEGGRPRKLLLNLRLGSRAQPYGAVILEQRQPVVFKVPAALYPLLLQYLSIPTVNAEL